ncbi:MAG: protein phosphatase 2C domain-containing protein [Endomicrobia bacterium]|nr:protein phosphatase 2C domain-containing protein [Endomicrobiia bacterium]MCL2799536.1 protein phosphatase 2C domain-containing protein [Endomicrobiia bacterium]
MKILYSARTDTGLVRKENQDAYGINSAKDFFIVCDGMGGGAAGDFASRCAVEVMLNSSDKLNDAQIKSIVGSKLSHINIEILRPIASIMLTNKMLYNLTLKYPKLAGMGTTVVATKVEAEKGLLHIYHSGDSRLYRIRAGIIELLTKDHSKVNELIEEGKMREEDVKTVEIQSMITRALGTGAVIKIDYRAVEVKPGDYYIMCSDGLNGEIEDSVIKDIVDIHGKDINVVTKELIAAANNAGGRDNTTALALRVDEDNTFYNPTKDYVFSPVTVADDTSLQSSAEDKFLAKYDFNVCIPKSARDRNFFTSIYFIGFLVVLATVSAGFLISFSQKHKKSAKELHEITGTVSGISLDVRTANDEQIKRIFKAVDDKVPKAYRFEIFKDIVNNWENYTNPLSNVHVVIEENGAVVFAGFSSQDPLGIKIPKGSYIMTLKFLGYKILDQKTYYLVDSVDLDVEPSGELEKKNIIMLPEKAGE